MSAAVPGRALRQRRELRHGPLGQAGQRVVFAQDPDDRPALAVAGDEGGGQARDAPLHAEAVSFGLLGERRGGAMLAQCDFRIGPDPVGQGGQFSGLLVD